MAFVYLLGDSGQDNMYKIGVTRGKIEKRIKQLQTGNGNEIYLVDSYETNYPFFIEHWLHMKFFPQQKLNEWFILNKNDVFNFKKNCHLVEENIKVLQDNPFLEKMLK